MDYSNDHDLDRAAYATVTESVRMLGLAMILYYSQWVSALCYRELMDKYYRLKQNEKERKNI